MGAGVANASAQPTRAGARQAARQRRMDAWAATGRAGRQKGKAATYLTCSRRSLSVSRDRGQSAFDPCFASRCRGGLRTRNAGQTETGQDRTGHMPSKAQPTSRSRVGRVGRGRRGLRGRLRAGLRRRRAVARHVDVHGASDLVSMCESVWCSSGWLLAVGSWRPQRELSRSLAGLRIGLGEQVAAIGPGRPGRPLRP